MESSLNNKQKPLYIGSVESGFLQTEQEKNNYRLLCNVTRRSQSSDECFFCPIASECGSCSAYNYEIFGTPNKKSTFICMPHKARVLANIYYWN
jgi:radical SAM protein with 4Fe4S-binding SPASM domain